MSYLAATNSPAEKLAEQIATWVIVCWAVVFFVAQSVFAWVLRPEIPGTMVLHVGVGSDVSRNAIVLDTEQITLGGWIAAAVFGTFAVVVLIGVTPLGKFLDARLGERWQGIRAVMLLVCVVAPMCAGILLGSGLVSTMDPGSSAFDLLPATLAIVGLFIGVMGAFYIPRKLANRILRTRSA